MALTAPNPESWIGGWTWPLPGDATCARRARALVTEALRSLAVPTDTVRDAELMVSELATNAHQHADGHLPYELWLGATPAGPGELICAVFDTLRVAALTGLDALENCDFGRGLGIVAELSNGRWGMYPTWARCEPHVAGKAVWFGCPLTQASEVTAAGLVPPARVGESAVDWAPRPSSDLA